MPTYKKRSKAKQKRIKLPRGRLGILLPSMSGAVSTTFIAGIEAIKRGLGKPIGSLTQIGTIRIGKRTENNSPSIKDFVPAIKVLMTTFREKHGQHMH